MKKTFCFNIALLLCCAAFTGCTQSQAVQPHDEPARVDLSEEIRGSLVYLEISKSDYKLTQPWERQRVSKKSGYGCAVGPYEILTIAENAIDTTHIQAILYGKNEVVPATVKVVDYEYNLCLLELDEAAMDAPLTPLPFTEIYPKGKQIDTYWLSSGNNLITARSTLDRAQVENSGISFVKNLISVVSNVSRPFGDGQICYHENEAVGIASWGSDTDSGIIPAETINRFLSTCRKESYAGFAAVGFRMTSLLDPVMRTYLKVPAGIKHGCYVSDVYTLGTGSTELRPGDVLLSIDGQEIDAYGRYEHPDYDRLTYHHLISQHLAGKIVPFEIVRDGKVMTIDVTSRSISSDKMIIPEYIYGKQPEYMVIGGCVFQKLVGGYLGIYGDNAPPHLVQYSRNHSFKPTEEREDIVILSFVFPAEINLGYQGLRAMVVDSVNGTKIRSMNHFVETVNAVNGDGFIEITFEMDSPTLVIPKKELERADFMISRIYGITQMMHVEK